MKTTYVIVEVHHEKDVPNLAARIAQRAYNIDGVRNAEAWLQGNGMPRHSVEELERAGFTAQEISLGAQEVIR
jgi:hypothetical protein